MSYHSQLPAPGADDAPTCTLWYIRRQLGRADYGDKRLVTYVAKLITSEGFPPPLPAMFKRELSREVTTGSRWIKRSVDAWLADFLPPANAAAVDRQAMAAAARELDAAAEALGARPARLTLIDGGRP